MSTLNRASFNPGSTWLSLATEVEQRQAALRALARPRRVRADRAASAPRRSAARSAPRAKAA